MRTRNSFAAEAPTFPVPHARRTYYYPRMGGPDFDAAIDVEAMKLWLRDQRTSSGAIERPQGCVSEGSWSSPDGRTDRAGSAGQAGSGVVRGVGSHCTPLAGTLEFWRPGTDEPQLGTAALSAPAGAGADRAHCTASPLAADGACVRSE